MSSLVFSKMKYIKLTKGKRAIVDDEDFEKVNQFKWQTKIHKDTSYASRCDYGGGAYKVEIKMHRFIINAPKEKFVDHINGNGLDNRKENLRLCTHAENQRNAKIRSDNKSGYKGVGWNKQKNKWETRVRLNGRPKIVGFFSDPVDAAKAYDAKAKEIYGDFARLNDL